MYRFKKKNYGIKLRKIEAPLLKSQLRYAFPIGGARMVGEIGKKIDKFIKDFNQLTANCFVPVTVGGGITDFDVAKNYLKNGDQVEILKSKLQSPSPNWSQFVKTPKAKSRIKKFIKTKEHKEYSILGLKILKHFFAKNNK